MAELEIPCKVCEKGVLLHQRVYRMSGPAVVIGYILLIPSLIGILLSGLFTVASWIGIASSASQTPQVSAEAAGCAGCLSSCFGIVGIVFCFVGGLLGWLLIMKKNVLKCNLCGSIVAAS